MKMNIDFYSKEEVSIRLDLSGRYPFPVNETSELFLFTCFTLRQLSNLGNHPSAKGLTMVLATFSKEHLLELVEGDYSFPGGVLYNMYFPEDKFNYEVLKSQIMPGLPKLIGYKGKGKKTFDVTLPPFQMRHKGFGILGFQANYYAFHSVISLLRYFAKERVEDEKFLDNLSNVAKFCGKSYIRLGPPHGDQVAIANSILREIGIIS